MARAPLCVSAIAVPRREGLWWVAVDLLEIMAELGMICIPKILHDSLAGEASPDQRLRQAAPEGTHPLARRGVEILVEESFEMPEGYSTRCRHICSLEICIPGQLLAVNAVEPRQLRRPASNRA